MNGVLAGIAASLVFGIMILMLLEVVSRYVFKSPTVWTLPITSYLLLYVVYLGTSRTLETGGHIRVEFLLDRLPAVWRSALDILSAILSAAFIGYLGYTTLRFVGIAFWNGEYGQSTLHIPLVLVSGIMPLGILFMFATSLVQLGQRLGIGRRPPGQAHTPRHTGRM